MSEWLKSLVGFMLLVSVTTQMLPNQKYEQYVRLFTGFLMIIILLQPILKIRSADTYLENKIQEFVQAQSTLEERIRKEGLEFQTESLSLYEDMTEPVEIPEINRVEVMVDD